MKALKRHFALSLPLAITALVATTAPASAAPSRQVTTIYSDTFTPLMRVPDGQALQSLRYYSNPGAPPNYLEPANGDHGHDAFFNSPDLTIGPVGMSAVAAEVCLTLGGIEGTAVAQIFFGVQDGDQNVIYWEDPDSGVPLRAVTTVGSKQCVTLTFSQAVKLVNHPHLVVAVELILETDPGTGTMSHAVLDGVTYTLRQTQSGDVTPNAPWPYGKLPNWSREP